MLFYVNYPWKEAESHWLLKAKHQIAEGKGTERKSLYLASWATQVRGKKRRVVSLTPPALHHCWGSLQPPRISSSGLSPAAQCCCGIGNLLWLRKIMGICFSKPKKSQTKFRREKKVWKQLILLEKLLAFSFVCHKFLWNFLVLWSEKWSYHVYYCCFFRVAGGEGWYSKWEQTGRPGSSKVKILLPLVCKLSRRLQG